MSTLAKAEHIPPENEENVLFQPDLPVERMEDDTQMDSSNPNPIEKNYDTNIDPELMQANKM